jgi:hypothetical protein
VVLEEFAKQSLVCARVRDRELADSFPVYPGAQRIARRGRKSSGG